MNERTADDFRDDERLPWLETVEDDYRPGAPVGRIVLFAVLALVLLGLAWAGYSWLQQNRGAGGSGELIEAQPGDYKVKPDEPGGMRVSGEGDRVFTTSQGAVANSSIDTSRLAEAPVDGTKVAAGGTAGEGSKTAKLAIPAKNQAKPATSAGATSTASRGGAGSLIQLGAFGNEAEANAAWARTSRRFAYVAALGKSVEKGDSNGRTVWRLRVNAGSNGQARELCGRLKVAGENCFVAN